MMLLPACRDTSQPHAPLTREAYIWQQQWRDPVEAAAATASRELDSLAVLAAVIRFPKGSIAPQTQYVEVPWQRLKEHGKPIAVVVRLGTPTPSFDVGHAEHETGALRTAIHATLEMLSTAGLSPSEIQVDFDCPEKKLAAYAQVMRDLRAQWPKEKWSITSLPSWLGAKGFKELVQTTGSYILQVHSLKLPPPGRAATLCDEQRSLHWAKQADKVGVPFRIALPTYRSEVLYDAGGKLLDVISEDLPQDKTIRAASRSVAVADPAAMARLVKQWTAEPPEHLTGLIWFRVPVEGDRRNWSMPAFLKVLQGEAPAPKLEPVVELDPSGIWKISIRQTGDGMALWPLQVTVRLASGAVVESTDARPEYAAGTAPNGVTFQLTRDARARVPEMPAGDPLYVGWVRGGSSKPEVSLTTATVSEMLGQ
ncbi:uncharacterized protein DUF3142 [Roseimicrobium gellanilyticum]|uniref:Uncharacterized protein DUF3142 n=2 Tax=Roseimicrobium gellanilyticum TaxID=748857 RepID=A0A366HE66_9BACT|nr:uncharacterized protein DUF3142 [Roseimicrobium gellanilyticum]